MAIAFDAATSPVYSGTRTVTFSHTASGTDRIVFVHATANQGCDISAPTYGGNTMTLVGSARDSVGTGLLTVLYYYINPPTGSQTVSVTQSGGAGVGIVGSAISYTGVDQSSPIDVVLQAAINSNQTTFTRTVTTTTADCWILATARFGSGNTITAGASTTVRTQPEIVFAGAGALWDSGGARAAGSNSVTVTMSSHYVEGTVTVGFKPAAGGGAAATGFFQFF